MSDTITVNKTLINDVNMLIAHYELGLSECLKIKKKLAAVSTAASKKKNPVSDEELAKIYARRRKLKDAHKKRKLNNLSSVHHR